MRTDTHTYPVVLERDEDGFFIAHNPSLPGCYSQGSSVEEALANIQEATRLYLDDLPEEEAMALAPSEVSVHLITA